MIKLILILFTLPLFSNPDLYERVEDKSKLQILTPALSERKSAKIRLKNGLEAYLVSDPGIDQSAAALAVEAGSWHNPAEYPGMAHFLEHMLFMGTGAYPSETEYMQYILDQGGLVNAYTAPDRTVYMFSINNTAFEGALDRFSHFFIDPLFLPSCIGRELHAVDQEHAKNIENDNYREYMIIKETGNPLHPNASFSTGNAATLSGIPQESLKKWYGEHYSAKKMHLVAISPLPLDEMIALVCSDFSQVADFSPKEISYPSNLFSDAQVGHIIYIKPIKDLKQLTLVWQPGQSFSMDRDRMVFNLAAYALNSGAENSLRAQLKREKLIDDLHIMAEQESKEETLLSINIDLTQQGLSQIDTVITRCFQAISRLKESGIPSYMFDELRKTALIEYQYQSRENAFEFAMNHAANMINEKLETYPERNLVPTIYDPAFIRSFLETLTPESCIYLVMADPRLTAVPPTTKEKWISAEYAIKEIPQRNMVAWAQEKPHPHIQLPARNPYIPQNLALLAPPEQLAPTLLVQDRGSKVYFAQDKKYSVPETAAIFNLKTPLLDGSAKSRALFDLYIRTLSEKIYEPLYFASLAGLSCNISQKDLDLTLSFNGYSEKIPLLLKTVFRSLSSVSATADQFELYKESLMSDYDNAAQELPVRQAIDVLSSIIYNDSPTSQEKLKALQGISHEEFLSFCQTVFKKAYTEGFIYGNLTQADAENLWLNLKTVFPTAPYPVSEQIQKRILILPEEQGPYLVSQTTNRQGNGVILLLQQGLLTFEKRAAQQVLSKVLHDGFFDTLRTKQQTAYIAKAWDMEVEKQLFQLFAVQSSTHTPQELLARFELFLEDFNKNFVEKISLERFDTIRQMLIKTLEMPPENLAGMAQRLSTLAFDYDGDFQWIEKRIEAFKNLSYEYVTATSKEFLSRGNLRRLAVLMEGQLSAKTAFRYEEVSKEDVCGLGRYVSAR